MQIIVICETRSSCQTDYKYIKSVFDYFYEPRSFSIKKIFAKTKSELINQDKKIRNEIKNYPGDSKIIIFSDVDNNDNNMNQKIINYANKSGFELVWMNGDIEEVFLGHKIKDSEKTMASNNYLINYFNILPSLTNLNDDNPLLHSKSSNILTVLDKFLIRKSMNNIKK